ncbi:MAG: SH3 domain-containing protein [Limnothrix sp. RL_2_0]|nr:SH3 domain-containing protein [Limnothrix sp. RL_2_0]
MSISSFFQFILGFILGVLLLVAGSVGAAYYFFNRMAADPPKPVFSETLPQATPTTAEPETTPAEEPAVVVEDVPEEEEEEETEEIPAGAYAATVTWSGGLSLRSEPSLEAGRIGGVDYNEEVLVLEMSDDKVWEKIRLADGTEAWVKAGNVKKIN